MKSNAGDVRSKSQDVSDNVRDTKVDTGDTKDKLIAVDLNKTRAVWFLEDTKWLKLCGVPKECPKIARIYLVSANIVVVGMGETLNFSLSTKQWKRLNIMPAYRPNSAAIATDDRMMILGGEVDSNFSKVCDILHVKHNKWSTAAALPKLVRSPIVALIAGEIYILPKIELSGNNTQLLVYDPLSNSYSHRSHLPSNIHSTKVACLVGVAEMLYLLGGEEGLAWQYNPHTDQWIQLVTPTVQYNWHNGCCAVVRGNKILLCEGSIKGRFECIIIEEYNIVTQQWKALDICVPFLYHRNTLSVMIASM